MESHERDHRRIDHAKRVELPTSEEVEKTIQTARQIIEEAKQISKGTHDRRARPPQRAVPLQDE